MWQGAEAGYLAACYHFPRQRKSHPPAHKHQLLVRVGQVHKVIARVSGSISCPVPSHESNYSIYRWVSPTAAHFSSLSDSDIQHGALHQLQARTNASRLHSVVRRNVCSHGPAVTFIPPSTEKMSKALRLISPVANSSYLS